MGIKFMGIYVRFERVYIARNIQKTSVLFIHKFIVERDANLTKLNQDMVSNLKINKFHINEIIKVYWA